MPELMAPKQKVDSLRTLLERMKPEMTLALPRHMTADRMARVALTACLKNPRLLECDPASFAGAILTASQIGLEPDGHEAHLVPFYNSNRKAYEVQLIPDYKGLAKLARNSGEIKTMDWREVRVGDTFKYRYGSRAELTHEPEDKPIHSKGEDGKWGERDISHCYAIAILDSGEVVFEVMRWEDVEWHRDRYSKSAGSGPWVTNRDAMGAKTCFRKLSKKLPRANAPLQQAVDLDEKAEQGIPQELGSVLDISTDGVDSKPGSTKLERVVDEKRKQDEAKANGKEPQSASSTTATSAPGAAATSPPGESTSAENGKGENDVVGRQPAVHSDRGGEARKEGGPSAPTPGTEARDRGSDQPNDQPKDGPDPRSASPTLSGLIDVLHQLYDDLGMSESTAKDKARAARERGFMWSRFVGLGVAEDKADPAKVQKLISELTPIRDKRKK